MLSSQQKLVLLRLNIRDKCYIDNLAHDQPKSNILLGQRQVDLPVHRRVYHGSCFRLLCIPSTLTAVALLLFRFQPRPPFSW